MKVDVTVFYTVIFQTCHAIVWYIIPITHHCAVMFCLISTDFFNFKLLLCLDPLPLTRRLVQTCSFEPWHLVCLQCFAACQTWDASSLDCLEFVRFLFCPSRPWNTLQLLRFLLLSVIKLGKFLLLSAIKNRQLWTFRRLCRDNLKFSWLLFSNHWHCNIWESKKPFWSVTRNSDTT